MKTCSKCKTSKPLEEFYVRKTAKDGRQSQCKACHRVSVEKWQNENVEWRTAYWRSPEVVERQLLRRYNLTKEQYEEMKETANSCCAICEKEKTLVIDHDHETGKVRGLLCGDCNRALGLFGDSIEGLRKAMKYLDMGL